MNDEAKKIIERLGLEPHPEGGYFKETWRSGLIIPGKSLPGYKADRNAGTSILFLLPAGEESAAHRVRSDEIWFYQDGDALKLTMWNDEEQREFKIGPQLKCYHHALVPGGWWQQAEPLEGPHGFSLVACVVVPGFDFDDFEM